jgi:hypothetical protein
MVIISIPRTLPPRPSNAWRWSLRCVARWRTANSRCTINANLPQQRSRRRRRSTGALATSHAWIGAPSQCIPMAESMGLIVRLGEWILHTACAQTKAWQQEGLPPLHMAVNVSSTQMTRGRIIDTMERVLKDTGLDSRYIWTSFAATVVMKLKVICVGDRCPQASSQSSFVTLRLGTNRLR